MNDADIEFGELEEADYQQRRRPDRDGHFAVVTYCELADDDLPVFIDMDVLAEIEGHANSDTSVELGGIMLGGQYLDRDGRPFVLVRDAIRAQEYESGRGHFKFTHETWTKIGQRREQFSADLHMVGWYHTHPGWGVFLSSMDQFICENFFDRSLDVALVVDPVENERGWFYWGEAKQLPQAQGFHVVASRFRQKELAEFVERLKKGKTVAKNDLEFGDDTIRREIVHTLRPQLGWLATAVTTMFAVQCCLLLIIALQQRPTRATGQSQDSIAELVAAMESDHAIEQRDAQLRAREEMFDRLVSRVKVGDDGRVDVSAMATANEQLRTRVRELEKTDLLLAELSRSHQRLKGDLQQIMSARTELTAENKRLLAQVEKLRRGSATANTRLAARSNAADVELSSDDSEPASEDDNSYGLMGWFGVGLALVVVAGAAATPWIVKHKIRNDSAVVSETPPADESPEASVMPPGPDPMREGVEQESARTTIDANQTDDPPDSAGP